MDKSDISHVELAEQGPKPPTGLHVELFKGDEVVLIPAPSADPKGMFHPSLETRALTR